MAAAQQIMSKAEVKKAAALRDTMIYTYLMKKGTVAATRTDCF